MKPTTKKILVSAAILIGVFGVAAMAAHFIKKRNEDPSTPAQGFSGIVQKAQKKHPHVYAWWESLSVDKQISIESLMTSELLEYLRNDFENRNLSANTLDLLRRAGYTM